MDKHKLTKLTTAQTWVVTNKLKNPFYFFCGFVFNLFSSESLIIMNVGVNGVVCLCHTPLWGKCEDETRTPKSGNLESSGTPKTSELDYRGQNTSPWGVLYTVGRSWSVDVENGLAWAIWTSTISGLLLGSPKTKSHSDASATEQRREYYMGEGGGFPWVQAVVSQVILCCPWLVSTPRVIPNVN
jgi:hypothetical protein